MSHNFRTLTWKKKNQTGADHFKFLMNSTNAQRSFVHELASQQLGHPPSNLWGVPIPQDFHQPADQKTLQFVRNAAKHPSHEFGRLISSHKTASGFIGALGDMIGSGAKASAGYLGKVGRFIGTHGTQIKTGVAIAKDLVSTGTTIAQAAGWLHPETKSTIDSIAAAVDSHAQGDHYKTKTTKGPKKGGYMGRVLI